MGVGSGNWVAVHHVLGRLGYFFKQKLPWCYSNGVFLIARSFIDERDFALEVQRNRHWDSVHGSSKNDTSPKKVYQKVSRFYKIDDVDITFWGKKEQNSFYWHQSHQCYIRLYDEKRIPNCKRFTLETILFLIRMVTPLTLIKDTEIIIGRHTRFNKTWWMATPLAWPEPHDYLVWASLSFKKCAMGGHNLSLTQTLKGASLSPGKK